MEEIRYKNPRLVESIGFKIQVAGTPFIVCVDLDCEEPSFSADESPFDCLTASQMRELITDLTKIVDTVERMTKDID
jgi:hypothetical protein